MKRLNIFDIRYGTRHTVEVFLRQCEYEAFAETEYYRNDYEQYIVQYRRKNIAIVDKLEIVYRKKDNKIMAILFN
jgi:hypothetical protein